MSRNTPVPEVDIVANTIADSDSGVNIVNIIVDVKAGEYSNGILFLDEPEDLYIIRSAIDDYIVRNHIKKPIHMNTDDNNLHNEPELESCKPEFLGVIEGYINTQYHPTRGFNPNDRTRFRIMTSQEIILDLADMVDMALNDVAEAMIYLGYRTIIYDGKVGWLLERRSE